VTHLPEPPKPQATPSLAHDGWSNIRPNPAGDRPRIHPTAYVDSSAIVIGNVQIGPRVFVGPCAVIQADETAPSGRVAPIEIGDECNVQDGVIIHALGGSPVSTGPRTSLSHGCVVHGPCQIGQGCFIGFRAVVFNARLADGVFVSAGAMVQGVEVPANRSIPPGVSVLSQEQACRLDKVDPSQRVFVQAVVAANQRLTAGYLRLSAGERRA